MKKIFYVALAIVATMFVACKDQQTLEGDTTKLWPAQQAVGEEWGYIDAKGTFVIAPTFDVVRSFSCGYAYVEVGDESKFIDKKGSWQATPSYDGATPFNYNYSIVNLDGNYGLMNNKFVMTAQPFFASLGMMGDNGLVVAYREGSEKAEYVNAKGETKIQAMYEYAGSFLDGVAVVGMGGKKGAINKAGDFIVQATYEHGLWNMGKGLLSYKDKNGKMGILDKKGNMLVAPRYYEIKPVSDGLILVKGKEKYGYINTKGEMVIAENYEEARPFFEGQAWVKRNEDSNWISIDKNNNVVFSLSKDENPSSYCTPVTGFHNGLALVATEDGYKYVNKSGALVYTWSYDNDYDYAPKKAKREQMSVQERMEEFNNMTLNFDSRKL